VEFRLSQGKTSLDRAMINLKDRADLFGGAPSAGELFNHLGSIGFFGRAMRSSAIVSVAVDEYKASWNSFSANPIAQRACSANPPTISTPFSSM
jgi:hypothetical protein